MTKPATNNKIIYQNVYGRVAQHEIYLNQGVRSGDSPTFANIQITGDATIEGNLYVEGNTTILDTNVIEFEDNIVLLNRRETGSGVTLNQSGFEIERGSLENYRIVFNESDDTFRIGVVSATQAVATREDSPMLNGIMTWNESLKRLDAKDTLSIDLKFDSTTNAVSATTGALIIKGGIGLGSDLYTKGRASFEGSSFANKTALWTDSTSNTFFIQAPQNISLQPSTYVSIPFNKPIVFGTTSQSISADSLSNNILVSGSGNVIFNLVTGSRISIPNQVELTFSTPTEKIYTNSSNDLVLASNQHIELTPGANKRVFIPVDIPLAFGSATQQLSANINNDLSIVAANNILLNPGALQDVRIPTDSGLKLGNTGNQKIYSNSSNELFILSNGYIYIQPSGGNHVQIPFSTQFQFGNTSQSINANTTGNLILTANNNVQFNSPIRVLSTSSSSILTNGGIVAQEATIDSTTSNALVVKSNVVPSGIFVVNANSSGSVDILAGLGLNIESLDTTNHSKLISLTTSTDSTSGYSIGRGTNTLYNGRSLTVNLPSQSDYVGPGPSPRFVVTTNNGASELFSIESDSGNVYASGTFGLSNTQEASNASTASFVISGGLGVIKNIITNGPVHVLTNSTSALLVPNTVLINSTDRISAFTGTLTVSDTNGNSLLDASSLKINTTVPLVINDTRESLDSSTGALVVSGDVSFQQKLRISDVINMQNNKITNVANPIDSKDAANKEYVDLVKQGLYVKDSVRVATTMPVDINNDLEAGKPVDTYVLSQGDRILVKDQLDPVENGLYIIQTFGIPLRSSDFQSGTNAAGTFVFVQEGNLNKSLGWICNSSPGTDTIGTDPLNFTQFTGLGYVDAGDGLSKNFNQLNVNVDNSSLEIVSDTLRIKNSIASTGLTGGSGSPLQTLSDQSHVTKLGIIDTGEWRANNIQVFYGGTGRTQFSSGCLLIGNGSSSLNSSQKLFFDVNTDYFGIGTNSPSANLQIQSNSNTELFLNADSDGAYPLSQPKITFGYTGTRKSTIGFTRSFNDIANNTFPDSLVISQDQPSALHIATGSQSRITVSSSGNVGINTSTPSNTLQVAGTTLITGVTSISSTVNSTTASSGALVVSGGAGISRNLQIGGQTRIYNTTSSTNVNTGALIVQGGISIQSVENASNFGNGGALTVGGGASFGGDVYISGTITGSGSSSSTFAYLTLTATNESINLSTGALITSGGITIRCSANSSSITNGGSLLVNGGASFNKDIYIGGNAHYYGNLNIQPSTSNVLTIFDSSSNPTFSINQNPSNSTLSLTRVYGFNSENALEINHTTGQLTLGNTTPSLSSTESSLVIAGGASILSTQEAISITSGGGLTVQGGQSISKNLIVGGDVLFSSTSESTSLQVNGGAQITKSLQIGSTLSYNGNGHFFNINNTSGSSQWYHVGSIDQNDYLELAASSSDIYKYQLFARINDTTFSSSHLSIGNIPSTPFDIVLYQEDTSFIVHTFVKIPASTTIQLHVIGTTSNDFEVSFEGSGATPDGTTSGFGPSWQVVHTTLSDTSTTIQAGDAVFNGSHFKIADNLPIVGLNNESTNSSRPLGMVFQRYQQSNDLGTGDIVTEPFVFVDTLPNQLTANSSQLILSNLASSLDDYYKGWWIKVGSGANINQVRKIIAYNGSLRVATLDQQWTSQNPILGDTVFFYNQAYVSMYYDEVSDNFNFATVGFDGDSLTKVQDASIQSGSLHVTSTNSSSIVSEGEIRILSTTNATSSTNGGSLTNLGGMGVRKDLFVGDHIGIGTRAFSPMSSLHINQTSSSILLENTQGSFSFVDFKNSSSSTRYGILYDNDTLALTYGTNTNPIQSSRAMTINSQGYIGINTSSNIASPLTLANGTIVLSNTNDGFIGLAGGNNNISSKIVAYGNEHVSSAGNLHLHSSTQGSVVIFTNDTPHLSINSNGVANIHTSIASSSATSGSLVVSGGIGISCSNNATNVSNGGALTVAGGASISKDIFIGGNLYITGTLNAGGSVTNPVINFSNTDNCTIIGHDQVNLVSISNQAILSFSVSVTPSVSSSNCQFEFDLPLRTNLIVDRAELIVSANGYTDDSNLIPLFNLLSVGVPGSTRGLVKFQSVSTGVHYINLICRYTMV